MISRLVHWFTPATPRHTVPRFHLQWHLTNACNLHCRHCYQDHQPEPDITFETVRATLDQAFDLLAFLRRVRQRPDLKLRLTLTGGEPLLSPVLFPLLELLSTQCSANDVECALLTNGTLIDRDCAHRLARYQPVYVQVSLDGPEALHEDMRGRGSFAPAVAGLQHLRQAGVTTSISFTAHAGNYRSFPEVARLGRELQVDRVWADRLIPCGRGHELATALMTPTQTEEFLHLMRQARSDAER
ncbi:MAG TPA: radical SAM protein, partial [Candidatus Ozemobacteraceae bacterium]|nr:radical SAM protein [Candidatus Ozemobacteraceae bacterium]